MDWRQRADARKLGAGIFYSGLDRPWRLEPCRREFGECHEPDRTSAGNPGNRALPRR